MNPNTNMGVQPQNPVAPIPQTSTTSAPPPQAPIEPTPPPAPKKRGIPKTLIFIVVILIFLGAAAFAFSFVQMRVNKSEPTPTEAPKKHVFEEYPDVAGIPIDDKTISFLKADGKFCLLYNNVIYLPQDEGKLEPRTKEPNEEMLAFPWIGLVEAPNADEPGEIYSFKESPSNKSFVFIARFLENGVEKYHMYRFNNNAISELRVFDEETDGLFFAPKISIFSPAGNFLDLSMFRCNTCLEEYPETLLYYIPTAETRNIGKTTDFSWGEDDNTYNYKQYEEGVSPDEQTLRTNDFFEKSIDLLTP